MISMVLWMMIVRGLQLLVQGQSPGSAANKGHIEGDGGCLGVVDEDNPVGLTGGHPGTAEAPAMWLGLGDGDAELAAIARCAPQHAQVVAPMEGDRLDHLGGITVPTAQRDPGGRTVR